MKIRGALKNGMVVGSLLMVLFLAPAAYGQDFVFRGVKLGCSLKEQDKSISFEDSDKLYNDMNDQIDKELGDPPSLKKSSDKYDVSGLKELGPAGYGTDGMVRLVDGKIEEFTMTFHQSNADDFSAMLTKKYGNPKSTSRRSMQTYGGAVLGAYVRNWQVKDVSIVMTSRVTWDIRLGFLSVSTKKMIEHEAAEAKKEKKKAMGNL